jgi:hypothetical protein
LADAVPELSDGSIEWWPPPEDERVVRDAVVLCGRAPGEAAAGLRI